ncbi:glycosyltransferase family 2 protein [Qingshengfaniella alkalisoli]|uniref:Glycosyltransferase family 2 protein n=1 Tax=Qingshengfaniella alkalisoli TaxID=2599296 RepID=A0A5B8IAP1_9RHOB|nr:glycosyltransferase family 2 protein [Qingshengfaniella alkalisoli]QDY70396.1 glycosyltransferase family 2 protein [Qingshengfaniella alkalisoli]
MPPVFSIVTPVYNAAKTVSETIQSIQEQTLTSWELWLVDDGSTDGSRAVIEDAAAHDARINVISLPGQSGAAVARNAAIEAATGHYIAFLDADDLWKPHKLAVQKAALDDGAGFVFSAYDRIDEDGRLLGSVRVSMQVAYAEALKGNPIGCLTAAYDTRVYGKVLMPDMKRRQDYALWLKLLRQHGPAIGIQESLARYRVRSNSLSSNKRVAMRATWRVYRDCEQLGAIKAGWYFAHYLVNAVGKRI